ncbi:DUF4280 domain-containing protein [Marinisporobacter balticus]|uniref:Uncharacterized protein DUF4280 n=1 Tax=Marinisporobacter balticus TaxID=2018667 RepID=A0A4R2K698_9FIRM|nr:DUF4280 domain-containing protein [Marinisporobacter balticus]TCO68074.1 uncharacterized protein DUF4280 [Marinisporobacter balticus]
MSDVRYVVHGAEIKCSCGLRTSKIVLPESHGEFIHDIPQLNVADSKPNINILPFGGCTSSENPSVRGKGRIRSFIEKIIDFFCRKSEEEMNKEMAGKSAGQCTPIINMPWIGGKKDVLIEDQKALLNTCTLTCIYGGRITITHSGQRV